MHLKEYKRLAKDYGFELWYDPSLKLWTMTKEGKQTEYFSRATINDMTPDVFEIIYLME